MSSLTPPSYLEEGPSPIEHYSKVIPLRKKQEKPSPGGNGGNGRARPFDLDQLQKLLDPEEREALLKRFAKKKDVVFDITEHHPILQKYHALVSKFLDAKPQTIITPLLPALAANVGNKAFTVMYGDKVFCNIWTIVMGPSSITRKTTALRLVLAPINDYDELLDEQYHQDMMACKDDDERKLIKKRCIVLADSTTEKFMVILQDNPNGLIHQEEIASFLTKMQKKYNSDFKSDITGWYDCPQIKKHETMTRSVTLRRPCFSISTASTKEWLLEQLNPKDLQSGFMQRFLLCNSQDIKREEVNTRLIPGKDQSEQAYAYLNALYTGLRKLGSTAFPLEIIFSKEAIDLHDKINGEVLDDIFDADDNNLFSYWSRSFTGYFLRLSILFTLTEHVERCIDLGMDPLEMTSDDLIVTERTAGYVLKLCHYFFESVRAFLQNEVETTFNDVEKKIVALFQKYKDAENTIKRSVLLQHSNMKAAHFEEAMKSLKEQNVVSEYLQRNSDKVRPRRMYTLILDLNDEEKTL